MTRVFSALQAQISGRRVLVFGLGLQGGVKVANRLVEFGATVRVTDRKSENELAAALQELNPAVETSLGHEDLADIEWAEIIFKNPAVPFDHPLILAAQEQGVIVTTETAFALREVRDRTIGITGTRGKTTTTSLIWHILKQAGWNVEIGGNIPQQPTLDTVLSASEEAWFVLELSSFQLEATDREHISPHVGVITSLSPDHLNRYKDMNEYVATKAALFRWQQSEDIAVWWKQPEEWEQTLQVSIAKNVQATAVSSTEEFEPLIQQSLLQGEHNHHNIALACEVARKLKIDSNIVARALATFTGVPYRQQVLPTTDGLTWINDTTATTPTALDTALNTFSEIEFILIAGGTTKNLPFENGLAEKLRNMQDKIIWLAGSGTNELQKKIGSLHLPHESMAAAVAAARELAAEKGISTIVLSPGFSSFEYFTNEFDRGDQFNDAVQKPAPAVAS